MPVREGFMPTPLRRRRDPGVIAAPAMKNAAEEMSPGTATAVPTRR